MKIIIKPSINVCTAVGKEKGGRVICRLFLALKNVRFCGMLTAYRQKEGIR
jgi:hypothetical protein